jgi:copper resistance protein B
MGERTLMQWLAGLLCGVSLALAAHAAVPLPPVTAEERAAAFPDVSGTDLHAHMEHDPFTAMLLAEQFEWQTSSGDDSLNWDITGWAGYDEKRLWLRSEGEQPSGDSGEAVIELLYGRPVAAWWDLLVGVRNDAGSGPARTYAALGVIGLAPQWLHVEATAYLGDGGQASLRLQTDYDWLLTNRWVLAARLEAQGWTEDDERAGIGDGLSQATFGLRLGYQIRPEITPYAGVEWDRLFGDTKDYARADGAESRDTRFVAGVRFWF